MMIKCYKADEFVMMMMMVMMIMSRNILCLTFGVFCGSRMSIR